MVGGGSLFFALSPTNSILADINCDLINYYSVLKNNFSDLVRELQILKASEELYYQMREYKPRTALNRAKRFAYLNRLCWNGLYRENKDGGFNVPFGGRSPKTMWSFDHLKLCSKSLSDTKFYCADFSKTLSYVQKNDFVFLDPPYPKGSNSGLGFNRYNKEKFNYKDHRRIVEFVNQIDAKGAYFMVTISNGDVLRDLYPTNLNFQEVESKTLISCNGETRGKSLELIIKNY